jgi:hypothetical protein
MPNSSLKIVPVAFSRMNCSMGGRQFQWEVRRESGGE